MSESEIERELTEAQADVIGARKAPARRRKAVMAALAAGWTKYKIAAVLGVGGPTVDAIVEAAKHEAGGRSGGTAD